MYVRNCWYVIAWDHEVPADGLFTRTVLDEPILLFRTAAGEIVGLRDRCCHRLAPLSKGRKEGDCVRCGYHGLLFDATGRCIEIPGSDSVPAKARVQRYPVTVKNKWVFVWMGDPAQADLALLPDNFSCDDPEWDYVPAYLHYETPQPLIVGQIDDVDYDPVGRSITLSGRDLSAGLIDTKSERGRMATAQACREPLRTEAVPPSPAGRVSSMA